MLNEALRLIRVFHDLSRSEVAERVGLSKSYVAELENKDKKVTLDVLTKYAAAFEIPLSSLMLFAEQSGRGKFAEDGRKLVADKTVKMLDWIATITSDKETENA